MRKNGTVKTMDRVVKVILIVAILMASKLSSGQQDPMYTQYMFNTQTINPAYAGTWESLGFLSLARYQYVGFTGAPRTYTFALQSVMKNPKVALGLNVISDELGLEKRLGVFGDYSYKVRLNMKAYLRLGLKAGFTNYFNNLSAYNLYEGSGTDPLFQNEVDVKFMPNFGVGAFLYEPKYYIGFSIPKLIQNKFRNNYNNYSVMAEMRHFYLNGGIVVDMGEDLKFKPTFMVKAVVGAPLEADLSANFLLAEKFWLGAMYRTGDSYGFLAQWVFNRSLRVGYAVDFSTTRLKAYHNGTHEVMVSYELRLVKEKFVSPRYF